MDRQQALKTLRAAKKAHIKWKSYAQAIHMGLPLDSSATPVIPTECDFGTWYYGDGQALNHMPAYRDVEKPHQNIHDIYMKMYKEKNKEIKVGLFGSKAKVEKEREAVLETLMQQMLTVSTELLEKIAVLEEEICHLDENCAIEDYKKKSDIATQIEADSVTDEAETVEKKTVKVKTSSLSSDLSDLLNN